MLENGVLLEGYRIDRLIGEGGMGTVYEATQLSLDRKVALKLLSTDLSVDSGFRERFRHEARIQGAMDHPNIVTVHEAGESEYGLFIAMELIRGATLKDLIVGRELDAGRTLRILAQVAEALDSAHEAGLIHRDIKPHNILVRAGRRDHAYLADFGVTKVRGGTNLTKTGHFVGTVDYMAPEQIRGEPATRETDIYALGTVLYECLSGVVPFPKDSDVAVMYAHLADPPPQLTQERPELPPQLDAVISTAMAKTPEERYASAVRMMEAFEAALGDGGKAAVAIPPPVETPEEIGLRDDEAPERKPDTAPSATRADQTKAAPVQQVSEPETAVPAPEEPAPAEDEVALPAGATVGSATVAAGVPAAAPTAAGAPPAAPTTAGAPPAEAGAVAAPAARGLPGGLVWGLAAVVVVALAVGGYLVGHSGGKAKAAAPTGGISAGKATVAIPSGWHEIKNVPDVPYLPLKEAVGMSPSAGDKDGLVLGKAHLTWPYLLPLALIGHESAQPRSAYNTRAYVVKIGKVQAHRTSGLKFGSATGLYTIFTFPQQGATEVPAAVCYSKTSSVSALEDCERVVSGISVSDAKLYDLVPSSAYASSVSAALGTLNTSRASGIKALKLAKTGAAQAKAARSLSKAYKAAGARLRASAPPAYARPANDKIVAAMGSAAGAYGSLATAAAAKSSSRYSAARAKASAAEKRLADAILDLRNLGYSVG